ncbi:MAG: hypothetical protein WDN25_03470 [Acetobacteraceae bacterium]
MAGTIVAGISANAAALELTPGRVLAFHSEPSGNCPGLDWHVVVRAHNQLTGLIAWNDMQDVVRVHGSTDESGRFQLAFTPVGGKGGKGSVVGQFPDHNGWLSARVMGAGCPSQDVNVEWFRTPGSNNG